MCKFRKLFFELLESSYVEGRVTGLPINFIQVVTPEDFDYHDQVKWYVLCFIL